MNNDCLPGIGNPRMLVARALKTGLAKIMPRTQTLDDRRIQQTLLMRRLRAERDGLDTSKYPPRIRVSKKARMRPDFERAWAKLLLPAAQILGWNHNDTSALKHICWLSWREARNASGK